jgi:hypothetical protein
MNVVPAAIIQFSQFVYQEVNHEQPTGGKPTHGVQSKRLKHK